jgi:hypothetical protein
VNERIRELAKQAGDYVNKVYTPPVRSKTPGKIWEDGHVDWHTQFNQKFAELLIREYEQFLPEICPWAKADEKGPMKGWHVQFVSRKHFGME